MNGTAACTHELSASFPGERNYYRQRVSAQKGAPAPLGAPRGLLICDWGLSGDPTEDRVWGHSSSVRGFVFPGSFSPPSPTPLPATSSLVT